MAVWDPEDHEASASIARAGGMVIHRDPGILDAEMDRLRTEGYLVAEIDARSWDEAVASVWVQLGGEPHPDGYTGLYEHLADDLPDVATSHTGLVFVVRGIDELMVSTRIDAEDLLGVIAEAQWSWALAGNRLLCLVESAAESLTLPAREIRISQAEWRLSRPD